MYFDKIFGGSVRKGDHLGILLKKHWLIGFQFFYFEYFGVFFLVKFGLRNAGIEGGAEGLDGFEGFGGWFLFIVCVSSDWISEEVVLSLDKLFNQLFVGFLYSCHSDK